MDKQIKIRKHVNSNELYSFDDDGSFSVSKKDKEKRTKFVDIPDGNESIIQRFYRFINWK